MSTNADNLRALLNGSGEYRQPNSVIGQLLVEVAEKIDNIETPSDDVIRQAVNDWLDDNPEAVSGLTQDEVVELIKVNNYRWKYVEGTIYAKKNYDYTTKTLTDSGNQYCCVKVNLNGESRVRLSGATSGSNKRLAYCFVDNNGNALAYPSFVSGELFKDFEVDVPTGAIAIYVNGSYMSSPHVEVAVNDLMGNRFTADKLLKRYAEKISYKNHFAWKPMETGLVAFSFDDSLEGLQDLVDMFIAKTEQYGYDIPLCFGAVPERLNATFSNGETTAECMKRAIEECGAEVLHHGLSETEIVTAQNIDDMNFLYNKFVVNRQKFEDMGFKVRGDVRVGGSGNIVNDSRTDAWVRLFFDYADAYGVAEPYNHSRFSGSTHAEYYAEIDDAIADKRFTCLLFHNENAEDMADMVDYVISHGGKICTWAYAYDNYGSTVEEVAQDNKIKAIESTLDGLDTALADLL